jgi:hypothetical protein
MAKKITTEKEAIEAVENGIELYKISAPFRKLESVILAAVKLDKGALYSAGTQTFEICVAAFQNAGEDILKLVYPELRTLSLLKACGIDVEEYEDYIDEAFEDVNDGDWINAENRTVVHLCGKGEAEELPSMQKKLRSVLETDGSKEWKEIWGSNPANASEYHLVFSPDKKSFIMAFMFGTLNCIDFVECINYEYLDFDPEYNTRLELFLYIEKGTEYDNSCEYWIFDPNNDERCTEHKEWTFSYSDYEDSVDVNDTRISWIEKRRDLWLLEGSKDTTALETAKTALATAEKRAEDRENERSE